eukprot:1291245-Pyramimonas_sp.AAC.1
MTRNIAVALPILREWEPISSRLKPAARPANVRKCCTSSRFTGAPEAHRKRGSRASAPRSKHRGRCACMAARASTGHTEWVAYWSRTIPTLYWSVFEPLMCRTHSSARANWPVRSPPDLASMSS